MAWQEMLSSPHGAEEPLQQRKSRRPSASQVARLNGWAAKCVPAAAREGRKQTYHPCPVYRRPHRRPSLTNSLTSRFTLPPPGVRVQPG